MAYESKPSVSIVGCDIKRLASVLGFKSVSELQDKLTKSDVYATNGEVKVESANSKIDQMIEVGANLDQICRIFSMDVRDVKAKIVGKVNSSGQVSGRDVYKIKDIAPYLSKLPVSFNFDEYFSKMSSADLPPAVNKDFWAAKNAHLKFLREKGEVVPLKDVGSAFSAVFKGFRTSTLLIRDAVERNTTLTDPQRKIINNLIDNLLETAYDTTISSFPQVRGTIDIDQ